MMTPFLFGTITDGTVLHCRLLSAIPCDNK